MGSNTSPPGMHIGQGGKAYDVSGRPIAETLRDPNTGQALTPEQQAAVNAHAQQQMSSGGAPAVPDSTANAEKTAAAAQAAVDRQTAANRVNTSTPFGSGHWVDDTFGGKYYVQDLSPELAGASRSAQGLFADALRTPLETGQQARDQAISGAYGQATSRLDPQWDQRNEALRSQLLNQGLDPTSEAYQTEMGNFSRARNDAYSSAMNGAIAQGTSAGDSVFRNSLLGKQYPLQQLQGLKGLYEQPGYNTAGLAGGTDYAGAGQQQYANLYTAFNDGQNRSAEEISAALGIPLAIVQAAAPYLRKTG